jgi:anti-sigma factor RsiW
MSLSRETTLELMALADGELDGEARERAEKLLDQNEEARRLVGALRSGVPAVRAWLGETFERHSPSADGIANVVMARLEGSIRSPAATAPIVRPPPKARRSWRVRVAVASGGLAIAALVIIHVFSGKPGDDRASIAAVGPSSGTKGAPGEIAKASGEGVEVEEIDSAKRVSIFEISGVTASAQSVVVWIDDDQEEK